MTNAARLNNKHIVVLRTLAKCDTTARGITLPKWMRRPSIHLWRRSLIEIWYRQSQSGAFEGPFFRLTEIGAFLALKFFPAPRGLSGVENGNGKAG
jgi:hypothetical protein